MVLAPIFWPSDLVSGGPTRSTGAAQELPIDDLGGFLTGRWQIDRRIDHAVDGSAARFSGVADFSPRAPGVLVYFEKGDLRIGGRVLEARRELAYRFTTFASAAVYFGDGSFFHSLDLSAGHDRVRYRCGADRYVGHFLAVSSETLRVDWHVSGPVKSYRARSLFARLATGSEGTP